MHKIDLQGARVAAGVHSIPLQELEKSLRNDEWPILESLSPRKRLEWIASRDLLRILLELNSRPACRYDEFGKPYLIDHSHAISVSHSHQWCAAMISDKPCGTDIQIYSDTVINIKSRFLSPTEEELFITGVSQFKERLHILWGMKECIYKAYGKRKLGFRENIFITELNLASGYGKGHIEFQDIHLQYDLTFRLLPEAAWVACIESGNSSFHQL